MLSSSVGDVTFKFSHLENALWAIREAEHDKDLQLPGKGAPEGWRSSFTSFVVKLRTQTKDEVRAVDGPALKTIILYNLIKNGVSKLQSLLGSDQYNTHPVVTRCLNQSDQAA